jgi:hypothetical protein
MITIPGVIFPCGHIGPRQRRQAWSICCSRLDSSPVLLCVRAPDFDLDRLDAGAFRHAQPGIASQLERIDRIGNYGSADAEIIFGDGIGYTVAGLTHRLAAICSAKHGLLYGIDAQVHCADLTRQLSGHERLANSRQSAEYNQHSLIIKVRREVRAG